ncbi:MAG: hypothetical protein IPK16_26125 [Anaerolineales bacterium]|nr:hypothetical protein [Anaerolineales bacterium]
MTALLFVFEGITGLDSPLQNWSTRSRPYWRVLGKLTFGGRNFLAENLRIAESLDTIQRYVREIIFANSPFAPVRRFFQRIIYWRRKPIVSTSTAQTVRYMLQDLGPTL